MRTTLITGASGGIGEVFARRFAARGENVLLVARSADKLAALCDELKRAHKVDAQFVALDLSERVAPAQLFEETGRRELEVETLVNNAGFGLVGDYELLDLESQLNMIDLNVRALAELAHRYLAPMRERRRGSIINVASTVAFQPVPFMATYAATKAFVLSLSESLWEENRAHGIKVLALCPGSTDTNFFKVAGSDNPPDSVMQTPEAVVDTALGALARGQSHVISGWGNFLLIEAGRLAPRSVVTRIAGKILRKRYIPDNGR
ncbi:MAG TPA: SDR family oxidoreductase [Pyrinomonadaceae bacterium]|jgi:short-subunit dehydrogenase|nr:SDR family oxidoreductase [Pyrinomonadaceae bacterium]